MPKQLLSVYFLGETDSKQGSFKNGKTSPLSVNFGKQKCLLCYFEILISQFRRGNAYLRLCLPFLTLKFPELVEKRNSNA